LRFGIKIKKLSDKFFNLLLVNSIFSRVFKFHDKLSWYICSNLELVIFRLLRFTKDFVSWFIDVCPIKLFHIWRFTIFPNKLKSKLRKTKVFFYDSPPKFIPKSIVWDKSRFWQINSNLDKLSNLQSQNLWNVVVSWAGHSDCGKMTC